jgi:hypothetical protein
MGYLMAVTQVIQKDVTLAMVESVADALLVEDALEQPVDLRWRGVREDLPRVAALPLAFLKAGQLDGLQTDHE